MCCIEESACDIVGMFWLPPVIRCPGTVSPFPTRYAPGCTLNKFIDCLENCICMWRPSFIRTESLLKNKRSESVGQRMCCTKKYCFAAKSSPSEALYCYGHFLKQHVNTILVGIFTAKCAMANSYTGCVFPLRLILGTFPDTDSLVSHADQVPDPCGFTFFVYLNFFGLLSLL